MSSVTEKAPATPPRLPPALTTFDETTIISPSKARARANHLNQISLIKSWLISIFAPDPVPARLLLWEAELSASLTADTVATIRPPVLKALQDLQFVNQYADELNRLLHEARSEELQCRRSCEISLNETSARYVFHELEARLVPPAEKALQSVSESLDLLELPNLDIVALDGTLAELLTNSIIVRTTFQQMLSSRPQSLALLQDFLRSELQIAKSVLLEVHRSGMNEIETEQTNSQITQWNRETKQITQKIAEYNDRVVLLERSIDHSADNIVVDDILQLQEALKQKRERVTALDRRLQAFRGLPPDLNASRSEVRRATDQLEHLKAIREGVFEQVGNG